MFSSAHVLAFGPREVHVGRTSDLRPRISIIFRAGSVFNVGNGQIRTESDKNNNIVKHAKIFHYMVFFLHYISLLLILVGFGLVGLVGWVEGAVAVLGWFLSGREICHVFISPCIGIRPKRGSYWANFGFEATNKHYFSRRTRF